MLCVQQGGYVGLVANVSWSSFGLHAKARLGKGFAEPGTLKGHNIVICGFFITSFFMTGWVILSTFRGG